MADTRQDELWSEGTMRMFIGFAAVLSVFLVGIGVLVLVGGLIENTAVTLTIVAAVPAAMWVMFKIGDLVIRWIDKVDGR
jgi:hypothetical protein